MSDTPTQKRNKPLNNGGQFRMLSIWLLVFFVILTLLYFANSDIQQAEELTIREVIQEAGKGEESQIVPGAVIKSVPQGGPKWHEIRGLKKSDSGEEDLPFIAEGQLTEQNLEVLQQVV